MRGDAGGVEVLVQQPRVRLGQPIRDGHAVQWRAPVDACEDLSHDGADLLVGVGARDHDGSARWACRRSIRERPTGTECRGETRREGVGRRVDVGIPREPEEHTGAAERCEGGDERHPRRAQRAGEVHHERPDVGEPVPVARDDGGRRGELVFVVVVVARELARSAVEPNDRGRPATTDLEPGQRIVVELAELGERRREAAHGGRVASNRGQLAGVLAQRGADRAQRESRREGSAVRLGEERCAQELGDPGQRQEAHVHEPVLRAEPAPQ